jgi:hypothetical protein
MGAATVLRHWKLPISRLGLNTLAGLLHVLCIGAEGRLRVFIGGSVRIRNLRADSGGRNRGADVHFGLSVQPWYKRKVICILLDPGQKRCVQWAARVVRVVGSFFVAEAVLNNFVAKFAKVILQLH